jgi:hypothetical protein
MRYTLKFYGRRVGAIGVNSMYTAEREAENRKDAELALYDEFEHIQACECWPPTKANIKAHATVKPVRSRTPRTSIGPHNNIIVMSVP